MSDETESQFAKAVVDLCHLYGYKVAQVRASRTKDGWRTAWSADGKGHPDLLVVGRGRVIWLELKIHGRKPTDDQQAWIDWLRENGQEAYIYTNRQWEEIAKLLGERTLTKPVL